MQRRWMLAAIIGGGAMAAATAQAQSNDQLFAKKTISIYVGYTPGGSYDLYTRMVAQHLGKYLPGTPNVIASNMPGAGSLTAANYIYEVAPKDGTALGLVSETASMEQALGNPAAKYDATKFTWIGRVASSNNIQLVWHTSKAQSVEDALTTELTTAGTGPANLAESVPRLLNALIGTKFKIITGYSASGPAMLAMEQGEVDGAGTSWAAIKATKQDWLRDKKIKIIVQDVPVRAPDLPDVPALVEFGKTQEDKQLLGLYASGGAIGRAVFGPPGLPMQVTKALQDGFAAMVNDPAFVADLNKAGLDVEPDTPDNLAKVVAQTVQVPNSIRARVRSIFGN